MEQTAKVIEISETQAVEQVQISNIVKAEKEGPLKLLEILEQISPLTKKVEGGYLVTISSNNEYELTEKARKELKEKREAIFKEITPDVQAADKLHDSLVARRKNACAPYEAIEKAIQTGNQTYLDELEKKRKAEEKRLFEEARKVEEERKLAEALQAEQEGNKEEAEAIIKEEVYVPPPVVQSYAPKVDKRVYKKTPRARIVNKLDIIKAVAANPALQDLIDINQSTANAKAKALGKTLDSTIKGLQYYEE